MQRKIIFILFIIVAVAATIYLESRINAFDLRFYHGKDGGAIAEFELVCFLSSLFFVVMNKGNLIIKALIGFVLGIVIGVVSYLAVAYFGASNVVFIIVSCILFITTFFALEKWKLNKENNSYHL
ncbi:hypothetical protein [Flavobacterium sp. 7A]|uniref:hypothetical protein n=1 Tax=Flavobacterium sp. 7A TaxID=2940571 RepID=UPI00222619D9|nr:hypothetical protein [Flavobacterium sp. 7A]MCW2119593.1 hypothetical protein [Flavobacterium sp. 7A]